VLVECTETMVIDLVDLETKAKATGAKYFVLSYMRGRIPDMDKIMALCDELGLYLIEDSAHAYGCEWKGRKIGTFGRSSTMSTQANKIMNSGEGGFLCTDDDDIMAKAIISAGSYEELFLKHCDLCPPRELMIKYRMTRVNYSIRMTNLQGALLFPQVAQIDVRREKHNAIYEKLVQRLEEHPRITVPPQLPEVTPVYDSIQFVVSDLQPAQVSEFQKRLKEFGKMKFEAFGVIENARNWRTWKFIDDLDVMSLPNTDAAIQYTFDTRLHFEMSQAKIEDIVSVIHRSLDSISSDKASALPGVLVDEANNSDVLAKSEVLLMAGA